MAVQSDAGTPRANPPLQPSGARPPEAHWDRRDPLRGTTPVTIAAEVTDGRRIARDDGRSGRTGADQQEGDDGIA